MTDKFSDQSTEGNLFLGAGVEFKGELNVPGCAYINGTFEGTLKAAALIVGTTGRVSGQIGAATAEIRGLVSEHLSVTSSLVLRPGGCLSGAIRYAKITVEEGGEISGTLEKIAPAEASGGSANTEATIYQLPRSIDAN